MKVFVDSNIPMYVAGADHPNRGPATRFLETAGDAGCELCTSAGILQEILYRYTALGGADLGDRVYALFFELAPSVFSVTLAETDLAKRILLSTPGLAARNAVPAGVMLNRDVSWLATFDQGFDREEGVNRVELG